MENQRIRLTKTLLRNALVELLQEKGLEKITVSELCARAQINRTTFYKYYGSQQDVLEDIERELFGGLQAFLLPANGAAVVPDANRLAEALDYLAKDIARCRVLINSLPDQHLAGKLFSLPIVRNMLEGALPAEQNPARMHYLQTFTFQGGYAVIKEWLNKDAREPAQEIADIVTSLGTAVQATF